MAWVIKLSVLLAVLIRTIHPDSVIKNEGDSFFFPLPKDEEYCLLSKSTNEENLLLWNTSSPHAPEFGDRFEIDQILPGLRINRLTKSDSGQYTMECWRDGRVSYQNSNYYSVGNDLDEQETASQNANFEEPAVELQCVATRDGNMTVGWHRLEQIVDCRAESKNISSYRIDLTNVDCFYEFRMCVGLNGHVCVSREVFELNRRAEYAGLSVGEEAFLLCFTHDEPSETEQWWINDQPNEIRWDPNYLTRNGNQMYVSDGRTSGNYSLVIPSAVLNDLISGCWCSQVRKRSTERYDFLVCPKSEPLTEFLSEGEEVVLRCKSDLTESDRVVWYRQSGHVDNVIMDTGLFNRANYPEDLGGRINASNPPYYLVLSNLSLADSGEYWCAVYYRDVCLSVTKTVLVEWDPFGINSTFYRVYSSLMACALLGMVCVRITVNLKTRRRDQNSLKTRRAAAQTQRQRSSNNTEII